MALGKKTGGRNFLPGNRGGPGRGRLSLEEKVKRKALLDHYKAYLESGQAVQDFQKLRKKKPEMALRLAEERIYGPPTQQVNPPGNKILVIQNLGQLGLNVTVVSKDNLDALKQPREVIGAKKQESGEVGFFQDQEQLEEKLECDASNPPGRNRGIWSG